ncbi:hypothetical protein EDC30_104202 [Paucimonas lemoignei]|uniref:Outer membrane protein n=1 Tax=Paucimonas lemoignei TaxID=29443 RepID=A0A4R3I0Q2_PAULE|nr:hypothetical protein [Paucimonas lemoignei]TCS37399.1 hypothetical protein EDC30_104202 [Paucimonas lemoignei]
MKTNSTLLLALFGALAANAAHAVGVTGELGTTGVGVHFSVPLTSSINARIGANVLNYSFDGSTSNVDYDFKLKLRTVDALLDWFPTANQFRLTAGVIYNGNKVDAVGLPTAGTYTLNGNVYNAATAGTLNGRIDFRNFAPYVGIGWGNAASRTRGWSLSSDLGAFYQGKARTSLSLNGCSAGPAICNQIANDVAAENLRLADKADDYRVYPVIRIGITYIF